MRGAASAARDKRRGTLWENPGMLKPSVFSVSTPPASRGRAWPPRCLLALCVSVVLVQAQTPAHAQAATAAPAPAEAVSPAATASPAGAARSADAQHATTLDTVRVVGAPRPLSRFPGAVDVLEGATLRDGQRGVDLAETLSRVPGFTAFDRRNYAQDVQIQSRGFGARSTFGIRGLRLVVDGIPASAADGQGQAAGFPLSSLDRIEVLRGPLALQYGNASGGAIIGESLLDGRDALGFEAWAGDAGSARAALRVDGGGEDGGALGDWRWRGLATRFETDGFRPHSAAVRNQANLIAEWRPSRADADVGEDRVRVVLNRLHQPLSQDPLGLTRAAYETDPDGTDPVARQFDTRKTIAEDQLGLQWRRNRDDGGGAWLGAYRTRRAVVQYLALPVAAQRPASSAGGVIDLARDSSGVDAGYRWAWAQGALSVGVDAARLEETRRGYENFRDNGATLGVRGALRRDERNRVESMELYAIADARLGERWSTLAALRRTRLRFDSDDRFLANGDDSGGIDRSETALSFGVARSFAAGEWFASVGRGFETPTITELAYRPDETPGFNRDLRPARTRSAETGLRWRGDAHRGSLAVYRIDGEDDIVPALSRGGRASFANAGRTRRQGVEFGIDGALAPQWSYRLNGQWTDARFLEDFQFRVAAGGPPAVRRVNAGNRIPGVPRTDAYAELGWSSQASVADADSSDSVAPAQWTLALEARAVGEIAVDDRNTDATDGYARVALRAQWRPRTARGWRVFARIDNLFDRRHVGSVIVNEANGRYFEPAEGRAWTVGIGWGW